MLQKTQSEILLEKFTLELKNIQEESIKDKERQETIMSKLEELNNNILEIKRNLL